jgi:hypothetical protein
VKDAERVYGVIGTGGGHGPHDARATDERRAQLRRERLQTATPVAEAIARHGSEGARRAHGG